MSHKNERCAWHVIEWLNWLDTRKFLAPPPGKSIMEALMQRGSGRAPNGPMNMETAAFHAAVLSVGNTNPELLRPWLRIYCGIPLMPTGLRAIPVKALIDSESCDVSQYYERAHGAANEILRRMSLAINMNLMMRETLRSKPEKKTLEFMA